MNGCSGTFMTGGLRHSIEFDFSSLLFSLLYTTVRLAQLGRAQLHFTLKEIEDKDDYMRSNRRKSIRASSEFSQLVLKSIIDIIPPAAAVKNGLSCIFFVSSWKEERGKTTARRGRETGRSRENRAFQMYNHTQREQRSEHREGWK